MRPSHITAMLSGLALGATLMAIVPNSTTVEIDAPPAEAIEISGPLAVELETKIKESAAPNGHVTCNYGVVSNFPDRIYCANGYAGFLLSEAVGGDLSSLAEVYLVGDKVYVR